MAEVFGVIARAAGLLDVGLRLSKGIRSLHSDLKNAPALIHALTNEVEDIRAVLARVQDTTEAAEASGIGTPSSTTVFADLQAQLDKARAILSELEVLIQGFEAETPKRRRVMWYRKKQQMSDLQQKLKEVRTRINELLVTHTSSSSTRIQLEVRGVHFGIQNSQAAITQRLETHSQAVESHLQVSNQGHAQTAAMIQALQASFSGFTNQLSALQEGQARHHQTLETIGARNEEHFRASNRVSAKTSKPPIGPERISPRVPDPFEEEFAARPDPIYLHSTLYISLGMQGSRCGRTCTCSCHSQSRSHLSWVLPTALKRMVGSLFFGYAGFPTSASKCNVKSCSNRRYLRLALTYGFPMWFINYSFHVLMEASTSSFKCALFPRRRIKNLISEDNLLFQARFGSPRRVRHLLRVEQSLILDVDARDGGSVLHGALLARRPQTEFVEMIRSLLVAGANPDQEDDSGASTRSLAADIVFVKDQNSAFRSEIANLFAISNCLDDLNVTFLHKIAAQYIVGDLGALLQSRSPEILAYVNAQDQFGRTPLVYAVMRGDVDGVRALLGAGAAVDIGSTNGWSAIFYAATSALDTCAEVIALLVGAGADVKEVGKINGSSPLHAAALGNSSIGIKTLLAAGVSIDCRDNIGSTPLAHAAMRNSREALCALIEHGADVNATDNSGRPPLALAVTMKAHKAQWVLLHAGADYRFVNLFGGIIHFLAQFGDEKSFRDMTILKLRGLDPHMASDQGWTATKLFESRTDISNDLRSAWDQLKESLEEFDPSERAESDSWVTESDSWMTDDEFVDAREEISDEDVE